MPTRRKTFALPYDSGGPRSRRAFLGENNTDGDTDATFSSGFFQQVRNYHHGRGGLRKRYGIRPFKSINDPNVDAVDGVPEVEEDQPIDGMAAWEYDGTRRLVVVCNGKILTLDDDTDTWTDITGSLTVTPGKPVRFTTFHNGTTGYLIGTNDTDLIWKWNGDPATEAVVMAEAADAAGETPANVPPARARDVAEYQGRVFTLNSDNGPTLLEISEDADESVWIAGDFLPSGAGEQSDGMALEPWSDGLLVFYRRSVHIVRFHYTDVAATPVYFRRDPVDRDRGTVATDSVVVRGNCFYADTDGIFEIYHPQRRSRLISRPIDALWESLNQERLKDIQGFPLGDRGEICWLVSGPRSPTHNMALVYNPEWARQFGPEVGWSVFETGSLIRGVSALHYQNEDDKTVNLIGASDGQVYEAWGDDSYPTGFTDDGIPVRTVLKTGYVDFGVQGYRKGIRTMAVDCLLPSGTSEFKFDLRGERGRSFFTGRTPTVNLGNFAGTRLGVDFVLGRSRFRRLEPASLSIATKGSARYFQSTISEAAVAAPHNLLQIRWQYVRERQIDG